MPARSVWVRLGVQFDAVGRLGAALGGQRGQQLGHPAGQVEEDQVGRLLGQAPEQAAQGAQQRIGEAAVPSGQVQQHLPGDHQGHRRLQGLGRRRAGTAVDDRQLAEGFALAEGDEDHLLAVLGGHIGDLRRPPTGQFSRRATQANCADSAQARS
jgi:hypothetical protein